jgi:hypothetical protein
MDNSRMGETMTKGTVAMLLLVLSLTKVCISQDSALNPREEKSTGLSIVAGGVVFGGIGVDFFLSSRLNLELDAGAGIGAGLRYHFKGDDPSVSWSPYMGLYGGIIPDFDLDLFGDGDDTDWRTNLYVPVGIHYISDSGFSVAFEAGYMHGFQVEDEEPFDIPWLGIKAGWHF